MKREGDKHSIWKEEYADLINDFVHLATSDTVFDIYFKIKHLEIKDKDKPLNLDEDALETVARSSRKHRNYYVGQWNNNDREGRGLLIENEELYEGYFKQGKKNGYGRHIDSTGTIYQGDFVNNKKTGRGKLIMIRPSSSNNDSVDLTKYYWHKGYFKNGKAKGSGVRIYEYGKKCKGDFEIEDYKGVKKDFLHWDNAIVHYPDGSKYQGCVWKDQLNKYGELTFPNKSTYWGQFFGDRMNGDGTFIRLDQDGKEVERYIGTFHNDRRDKRGTLVKDGKSRIVEYDNGILIDANNLEFDFENSWKQKRRSSLTTVVTQNFSSKRVTY